MGHFRDLSAKGIGHSNISLEAARHLEIENMGNFGRTLPKEPAPGGTQEKFHNLATTETSNVIFDLSPQPNGELWFGRRILSHDDSGKWHTNLYVIFVMLQLVRLVVPMWSPAEILISATASHGRRKAIEAPGSTARFQQRDTGFVVPLSMLALALIKIITQRIPQTAVVHA